MFCSNCGAQRADDAEYCPKCGTSARSARNVIAANIGQEIRASSRDAVYSARSLLLDPVGSLDSVYQSLGATRARSAGAALGVLFAILCAVGLSVGAHRFRGWLGSPFGGFLTSSSSAWGLGSFLKVFLAALVPPAALTLAAFGIRRILKARPPLGADIFVAGIALLPLGIAQLVMQILGVGNLEVALLLVFVAWCYLVLILYTGLTRVGGLSNRAGAPAVPFLIVLSAWITKVVWVALM